MINILGFLKKNDYILSPEISGHLTQDGKILANKEIYLEGSFLKHRYEDKTKTDLNGYFHFEPMIHSQWLKKFSLNQAYSYFGIYLVNEEERIYLWHSILDYDEPLDLIVDNLKNTKCEINSNQYQYYFKNPVVPHGVDLMVLSRCKINGYKRREKRQKDLKGNTSFNNTFFLTVSYQVYVMDIFKQKTYDLTPKIHGRIFNHGILAANIEVTLEISALNDTKELKAYTNQNGEFFFEAVSISTIKTPSIFDPKMVSTSLSIKRDLEYKYLWRSYLPGYSIFTFMSENLSNLTCDINSKEKYFIFDAKKKDHDGYEVHTICDLHGALESGYIEN